MRRDKGKKMKILFLTLIFLIIVFTLYFNIRDQHVTVNTEGIATLNNPIVSPSGKYQLNIIEEYIDNIKQVKFVICKISNGKIVPNAVFCSYDSFRTRDTLYFIWGDDDKVWVYSGDVGTFFWTCVSDTNWGKKSYAENKDIPVPEMLKKLKPGYYN